MADYPMPGNNTFTADQEKAMRQGSTRNTDPIPINRDGLTSFAKARGVDTNYNGPGKFDISGSRNNYTASVTPEQ